MAARDILLTDVLAGLLCTVLINDENPTEVIQITNVKTEEAVINEEPEVIVTPTVSQGVERRKTLSYTTAFEFTIDENETDIIAAIRALDTGQGEVILTTDEGGDNGTGKTVTITAADIDAFYVEGHKVKIVITKKVAPGTLAYTVAHVAA